VRRVHADVLRVAIAHARDAAPAECCGVLIGTGERIVEAVRARNIADRPTRFEIDPKDHLDARRLARSRGLDVVGFYHSHPHSAASPSETDLAEAYYPDLVHLIVSLATDPPETRLFRPVGLTGQAGARNFVEEAFVTVRE
jgi:desampylase